MLWIYCYLAITWLLGFAFINWSFTTCDDQKVEYVRRWHPGGWMVAMFLFVALAPLYLPVVAVIYLVLVIRCLWEVRTISRVGQRYREPQFRSINFYELDRQFQNSFDNGNGEFLSHGFELMGDFQNKEEPVAVFNRCYAGCEGTVFGDITALFDTCSVGLMSITADGTYVETAATDPYEIKGEIQDDDKLVVRLAGVMPLSELLELHLQIVRETCQHRKTSLLAYENEQFKEVTIFGQRRFWGWRKRCGEKTGTIPEAVVPQGTPVDPIEILADNTASG